MLVQQCVASSTRTLARALLRAAPETRPYTRSGPSGRRRAPSDRSFRRRKVVTRMNQAALPTPGRTAPRSHGQRGMSLIEVLVAALIMVVVALGLIPLFTRSMRQNREGANFTDLTNVARSALEEYLQMDFIAPRLTIPPGSEELVVQHYWNAATEEWLPLPADLNTLPATARFERTIQVQQFASGDLILDGTLDDPLAGDAPAEDRKSTRLN